MCVRVRLLVLLPQPPTRTPATTLASIDANATEQAMWLLLFPALYALNLYWVRLWISFSPRLLVELSFCICTVLFFWHCLSYRDSSPQAYRIALNVVKTLRGARSRSSILFYFSLKNIRPSTLY